MSSQRVAARPAGPPAPPGPAQGAGTWSRAEAAVLLVVIGIGVITATTRLGSQPLWYDEIASAWAARLPWTGLVRLLHRTDANLGLYYGLMHVVADAGRSPWLLRLPSAVAGVATVAVTAAVGRRVVGGRAGLLGAGLLAVHPFAAAYARDARPYALDTLCCTAAVLVGLRARERPTVRRLAPYAALSTLAVGFHLYAALVVAAVAVALLPARHRGRARWVAAHGPVAAAGAVLLVVSLRQRGQLHWVPALTPGSALRGTALLWGGYLPLALVVAAVVVTARRPAAIRPGMRLLLAWLLVPLLALVLASLVAPTFVPRYLEPTLPAECLLLASALTRPWARGRRGLAGTTVVAAALCLGTVQQIAAPYHYEDYRGASRELLAAARPGDGIVYGDGSVRLGMSYYLPVVRRIGQHLPVDALAVPGAVRSGFAVPLLTGRAASRALAAYRRVWVVDYARLARAPAATPAGAVCGRPVVRFAVRVTLCRR